MIRCIGRAVVAMLTGRRRHNFRWVYGYSSCVHCRASRYPHTTRPASVYLCDTSGRNAQEVTGTMEADYCLAGAEPVGVPAGFNY